mgnify:CR=1 FL=1
MTEEKQSENKKLKKACIEQICKTCGSYYEYYDIEEVLNTIDYEKREKTKKNPYHTNVCERCLKNFADTWCSDNTWEII